MKKCNCGAALVGELMHESDCEIVCDGPRRLPVVKYMGELWFVDFRLKERRNFYTAERDRFDSGGIDEEFFREKIADARKNKSHVVITDCDGKEGGF